MHAYSKDPLRLAAFAAPPSYWPAAKANLTAAIRWFGASWPVKAVRAAAAGIAAERLARETIHELKGMDDHMLRDIGLARTDIEAAVRGTHSPFCWQADADSAALRRLDHFR